MEEFVPALCIKVPLAICLLIRFAISSRSIQFYYLFRASRYSFSFSYLFRLVLLSENIHGSAENRGTRIVRREILFWDQSR